MLRCDIRRPKFWRMQLLWARAGSTCLWAYSKWGPLKPVSPGFQLRERALLVIPIVMAILILGTIFVVSVYIKKVAKKPTDNTDIPLEVGGQIPEEIEDYPGHNTAPPVQETLHGCQPVAQEDGKESRISVQERQATWA